MDTDGEATRVTHFEGSREDDVPGRLPGLQVLYYALPALPTAALVLPIFAYLPQLYAESPALGLAVVGSVFGISKIWDVVTDPMLGILSDRVSTRYGRRRPWIVAGVPIMLIAVFFLFLWPGYGGVDDVGVPHLLSWLLVLYVGWTMLTLSHLAWGAELSADYDERSRILGTRELLFFVGTLVALIPPALIERMGGTPAEQVASMGWIVIVLLPVSVFLAVTRVQERPHVSVESLPSRRMMYALFANRPLRRLLLTDLALMMGNTINASMFLWLARDVLALGRWSGSLLFVFVIFGSLFIPVLVLVSYRIGKHWTLFASCILNICVLPALFFVPQGEVLLALGVFLVLSLHLPAGPVMVRSMAADVVDHDHAETGQARTGLVFSLMTMTNKIGAAFGVWFAFAVLDVIGFEPGVTNDAATLERVRTIYIAAPILINLVVAAAMMRFPLTRERQRELRKILG